MGRRTSVYPSLRKRLFITLNSNAARPPLFNCASTQTTTISRYHDENGSGKLIAGTDGRPRHTAYWHDALGRQIAMADYGNQGNDSTDFDRTDPSLATIPLPSSTVLVSQTVYNDDGEAFKTSDPSGKETKTEFDDAGRRTKTIENYDDGNPATGTNDKDVTVEFTYTADGNLATIKAKNSDTGDQTTTYVYGTAEGSGTPEIYRNDLLRAVIYPDSDDVADPLGNGTDATYDRVEYMYNRQGEVIERKDPTGTIHEFDYDKLGRQTVDRAETLGSGVNGDVRRIETSYDNRGAVETISSYAQTTGGTPINQVVREFNKLGMVTKEHQDHDSAKDGGTPYVEYTYDETVSSGELTKGMRLTKIRYPNGRLVHHYYGSAGTNGDNLGRLSTMKHDNAGNPGVTFASYKYLGENQIVEANYPIPDVKLDMAWGKYARYDRFFRNIDNKWRDYGSASDVDRYKYGYDQASNRSYRENTVSGSKDELYTYDGLHRLKNFDRGNLNGTYNGMTGTIAKEYDWDLDATGNWESLTQKTSGSTDFTQNRDHNEVNELTSADDAGGSSSGPGNWVDPAYDNNGNMTTLPRPSSLANSYIGVYDAWNRLIEVKIGSTVKQANEYDGLHRRIVRDESNGSGDVRHFYYSQQWQVLEERVGSSSNAFAQYVYGPRYVDEIIFRERDTNDNGVIDQKHYYLQDANFNVTALVNTSGDAQERYLYDPYGEVTIMDGSWGSRSSSSYDNEMLFTGRRVDPETGLQLNRLRFHHQQLGRWVSRDPMRYGGSKWNLYEYVKGMPLFYLDSAGLEPWWWIWRGFPKFCLDENGKKPWHPPGRNKCSGDDTCGTLLDKIKRFEAAIYCHNLHDLYTGRPGRHKIELDEFGNALDRCWRLYDHKECRKKKREKDKEECPPLQNVPPMVPVIPKPNPRIPKTIPKTVPKAAVWPWIILPWWQYFIPDDDPNNPRIA